MKLILKLETELGEALFCFFLARGGGRGSSSGLSESRDAYGSRRANERSGKLGRRMVSGNTEATMKYNNSDNMLNLCIALCEGKTTRDTSPKETAPRTQWGEICTA